MRRATTVAVAPSLLLALALFHAPAAAQYRTESTLAAGEPVPSEAIRSAGAAGRALSQSIGVKPVLLVFWRPGDAQSEQALAVAASARARNSIDVALVAPAVLAAGQRSTAIASRLSRLGLTPSEAPVDSGPLARLFGIRRVPTIALIDVGGVLRFIGATSVLQDAGQGMTVLDAMAMAGRGEPVPTLGVLSAHPVYRLLGREIPSTAVTEPDGKTWRALRDFLEPGKKLMVFYWAPECPHCREEIPRLCSWYRSSMPEDLVLVDVARTSISGAGSPWEKLIADCPTVHLLDENRQAGRELLVTETPTTFLVNDAGEVISIQVGGDVDWAGWAGESEAPSETRSGGAP